MPSVASPDTSDIEDSHGIVKSSTSMTPIAIVAPTGPSTLRTPAPLVARGRGVRLGPRQHRGSGRSLAERAAATRSELRREAMPRRHTTESGKRSGTLRRERLGYRRVHRGHFLHRPARWCGAKIYDARKFPRIPNHRPKSGRSAAIFGRVRAKSGRHRVKFGRLRANPVGSGQNRAESGRFRAKFGRDPTKFRRCRAKFGRDLAKVGRFRADVCRYRAHLGRFGANFGPTIGRFGAKCWWKSGQVWTMLGPNWPPSCGQMRHRSFCRLPASSPSKYASLLRSIEGSTQLCDRGGSARGRPRASMSLERGSFGVSLRDGHRRPGCGRKLVPLFAMLMVPPVHGTNARSNQRRERQFQSELPNGPGVPPIDPCI